MLVEELLDNDVGQSPNDAQPDSLYDSDAYDDHGEVGAQFHHGDAGRRQQYADHLEASERELIGENADDRSNQVINGTGVKEWR